jgi:hypothetical protein
MPQAARRAVIPINELIEKGHKPKEELKMKKAE